MLPGLPSRKRAEQRPRGETCSLGHLPLTPSYATEESVAGPGVLLTGSGIDPPELSMRGIMEPAPCWARALGRAPRKSPATVGRSPSMGEGGADLRLGRTQN